VSATLGVLPSATIVGVARERTRPDPLAQAKQIFVGLLLSKNEAALEADWKVDKDRILNPAKYGDKQNYMETRRDLLDVLTYDIGPGSIDVRRALLELDKYRGTSLGKSLGLDQYDGKLTNFVRDLNDTNNPQLTITIAGLLARDAQVFFTTGAGKAFFAVGQSWDTLSAEDKTALTASYYLQGEENIIDKISAGKYKSLVPGKDDGVAYAKGGTPYIFFHRFLNSNPR
jgi:hypothetical protein